MIQVNSSLLTFHPFVSRDNPSAFLISLGKIDFQLDQDFQFQVQAAVPLQRLPFQIQSVYLDASLITTGVTTIIVGTTGQRISIKAGFQGYMPLLCNPGSQVFTFHNQDANGSGSLPQILFAFLLNVPVIGMQWQVNGPDFGSVVAALDAPWVNITPTFVTNPGGVVVTTTAMSAAYQKRGATVSTRVSWQGTLGSATNALAFLGFPLPVTAIAPGYGSSGTAAGQIAERVTVENIGGSGSVIATNVITSVGPSLPVGSSFTLSLGAVYDTP